MITKAFSPFPGAKPFMIMELGGAHMAGVGVVGARGVEAPRVRECEAGSAPAWERAPRERAETGARTAGSALRRERVPTGSAPGWGAHYEERAGVGSG